MADSNYREQLIKRLIKKEIDKNESKQLENEFIEVIGKLGFHFKRNFGYLNKLFKNDLEKDIYLLLTNDMDYDEENDYTAWGHWQICDKEGSILFYISSDEEPNIGTWFNGKAVDATACIGFWKEGIEAIKPFIEKYRKHTRK